MGDGELLQAQVERKGLCNQIYHTDCMELLAQYFNFLFQQGNIQIDLNIGSGRESNYQPFAIYKEQVLKLLADTNMTQSKKEDLIVALFAYVQGLTTLATMENVHYAYKWEDKLTDLIGIFSCEF